MGLRLKSKMTAEIDKTTIDKLNELHFQWKQFKKNRKDYTSITTKQDGFISVRDREKMLDKIFNMLDLND